MSKTYEGGLGGEPGNEAHGGYTFCGLAALSLCGCAEALDLHRLTRCVLEDGIRGSDVLKEHDLLMAVTLSCLKSKLSILARKLWIPLTCFGYVLGGQSNDKGLLREASWEGQIN